MQIVIEAKDADDLEAQLCALISVFGKMQERMYKSNATAVAVEPLKKAPTTAFDAGLDAIDKEEEPAPKKTLTIKAKVKKAAPPPPVEDDEPADDEEEDEEEVAAEEPAPTKSAPKAYTSQDAVAALQEVNSKKGLPTARKILSDFNCTRISEVPQKKFGLFISACKEAITASA